MSKKSYLKTLESRKHALLAESEVNRVELRNDWEALKDEVIHVKKQLVAAGSIASSAALVTATLAATAPLLRRRSEPLKSDNHNHNLGKASWVASALNGARVGASLFFKVRSFMRDRH